MVATARILYPWCLMTNNYIEVHGNIAEKHALAGSNGAEMTDVLDVIQ